MRIIFFGSDPWFSPPVLGAILKAGHEMPIVITKGDAICKGLRTKDEGRRKIQIIQTKESKDISLNYLMSAFSLQPSAFSLTRPDAIVLAAFGPPFLPAEVLNWPKYGCLNVHASLLPRWRGASPVFGALANGDRKTGVTIMKMIEEVDRGPILGQANLEICQPGIIRPGLASQGRAFTDYDNRESLTCRLGILGGKLIVETLKKLQNGQINEVKQPPKSPTAYTHRLIKDSGRIDWSKSPIEIERFIRAVTPWPGGWTRCKEEGRRKKGEGKIIKILEAHLESLIADAQRPNQPACRRLERQRLAGKQLITNNQQLVIDLVQLPGKNPISWKQFLAGHPEAKFI